MYPKSNFGDKRLNPRMVDNDVRGHEDNDGPLRHQHPLESGIGFPLVIFWSVGGEEFRGRSLRGGSLGGKCFGEGV